MKHILKNLLGLFVLLGCLTSCENPLAPFDVDAINQVKDSVAPEITIISPEQGGTYSSTVVVRGILTDSGADGAGGISSVSYEILNTEISGTAEIAEDNSFSFQFSSYSGGIALSGNISIRITAEDWNGNTGFYLLSLDNDAGAFSYFEVTTGNRSAEIAWDVIPLAESYTIIYTNDGTEPSYGNGIEVAVPATLTADSSGIFTYTVENLTNGDLYRFRLFGDCSDGQRNASSTNSIIPLSPYYLYPSVKTEFETVELNWFPMEGADSYRVYRSSESDGSYKDVSGLIARTYYTDKNLVSGRQYFYRIAPSIEGSVMSEPAYASPNGMNSRPEILASVSAPLAEDTGESDLLLEIIVEGDYAYGLLQYGGVVVYDISSPSNPKQIFNERYTEGSQHYYKYGKITFYDDYLYVSCCSSGLNNAPDTLLIYSLENFAGPQLVKALNTDLDFFIYDFIPYNDYLYIGAKINNFPDSNTAAINVLDISAPGNVVFASDLSRNDLGLTNLTIEGMAIHNGELYLSNKAYYSGTYLYIYDIASPTKPAGLGNSSGSSASECGAVYIEGDAGAETAYVLGGSKKFQVLDVSNPSEISEIASYNEISNPQGMAVYNGYAYITYGSGTLQYIGLNGSLDDNTGYYTISDSRIMVTKGSAEDIVYNSGYLWIADGSAGLTVVEPASFGSVDAGGEIDLYTANRMVVSGDYAYITEGLEGFRVLSVSNTGNLTEITAVDPIVSTNSGIVDVAVHGKYLYAACAASTEAAGLFIYDIEKPAQPELAGTSLSYSKNLDVAGSLVFAVLTDTILILDSSDPEDPEIISSLVIKGAVDLKVQGNYLYVYYSISADNEAGIAAVNVTDPYQPRVTGSCTTGTASSDGVFALTENYAYIGKQDLYIVDISNPESLSDGDQVEDDDETSNEGWNFWGIDYSIYGMDTDGRYLYLSIRTPSLTGAPQLLSVLDCAQNEKPVLVYETEAGTGNSFCLLDGERIYLQTGNGIIKTYNLDYWE